MVHYLELKLSKYANLDEAEYRDIVQAKEITPKTTRKWVSENLALGMNIYLKKEGIIFKGNVLELGAGHCWFSAELSKIPEVEKIYAVDISRALIRDIAPKTVEMMNGNLDKIIFVHGDFYDLTDIPEKFDFIVYDAALHHADLPVKALEEAKKMLRVDGRIICVREPLIPIPFFKGYWKKKFGKTDREYGVTENTYTLKEWKEIFNKAGLELRLIPFVRPNNLKDKILNLFGIILNYVFVAKRV